jgi:23S rRNA (uracil1939-C5)-methyltransferase
VQQLNYEEQLAQKQQQVENIFQRQAGIEGFKVDKIIPSTEIFHYRNKMEFTFSNNRWVLPEEPDNVERDFALGMHIPKRWDKILNLDECHLMPEIGTEILNKTRSLSKELKLKPYDQKTHNGFLRYLILRFGHGTGQIMVNIVTSYENLDLLNPLVDGLLKSFPQITTVVNNINSRKADVSFGQYELTLHGKPSFEEKLGELTFEISANSFFQTNSIMAEKLYQTALDAAQLSGDETVFDLYCGTGSISLFVAQKAKEVHGFEVIVSAIEDATRNAVQNGIGNAYFHVANLDNFFKFGQGKKYPKPDVIFIDPPRAGMHKFMTNYLPKFEAKKIIYISCNPSTQARDTEILQNKGYSLKNLTVVDMFPHTPHIESVGVFQRN